MSQKQQRPRCLVAHTHSHTVVYSHRQQHTHKVTLMKAWVPGAGGNPEAVLNTDAFCDELNTRLLNIDGTLLGLLAIQPHKSCPSLGLEAARRQLEGSLEKQVAFSTALLLDWCGAAPAGSSEHVLRQLLQHQQAEASAAAAPAGGLGYRADQPSAEGEAAAVAQR